VSIDKGGNSTNYSHATAVPAVRDWIESYVTPQIVAEATARARAAEPRRARCKRRAPARSSWERRWRRRVSASIARSRRRRPPRDVPAVWVVDESSTRRVLQHRRSARRYRHVRRSVCSSGASGVPQTLSLAVVLDPLTFDS